MLSRLNLSARGPDSRLLPGLPCPSMTGAADLLPVLGQALAYAGFPGAFPALAAVSGEAFRLRGPVCAYTPRAPALDLSSVLAALGYRRAEVLTASEGIAPERILQLVAQETAADRPVVLGGWPPAEPSWALLAGCPTGGLICGYGPHNAPGDPYIAAPAQGNLLLALGPGEPAHAETLRAAAAAAARACWEQDRPGCAGAYRTWLHLLSDQVEPTAPVAGEAAAALTALVGARTAARDFLEAQREQLPQPAAAWVARAAALYDHLLDLLEPLSVALAAPEGEILWAHPEWRAEHYERLEQIAELDAEAVNCLRRSGEEYTPDEV